MHVHFEVWLLMVFHFDDYRELKKQVNIPRAVNRFNKNNFLLLQPKHLNAFFYFSKDDEAQRL